MSIEVESGIPIPEYGKGKTSVESLVFASMLHGQSMVVSPDTYRRLASFASRNGFGIRSRNVDAENKRVWKVMKGGQQ